MELVSYAYEQMMLAYVCLKAPAQDLPENVEGASGESEKRILLAQRHVQKAMTLLDALQTIQTMAQIRRANTQPAAPPPEEAPRAFGFAAAVNGRSRQ
jgi:hypothetical protein